MQHEPDKPIRRYTQELLYTVDRNEDLGISLTKLKELALENNLEDDKLFVCYDYDKYDDAVTAVWAFKYTESEEEFNLRMAEYNLLKAKWDEQEIPCKLKRKKETLQYKLAALEDLAEDIAQLQKEIDEQT